MTKQSSDAQEKPHEPLIVIASNRGPYSFSMDEKTGEFHTRRGSGGLVTALAALAERHDVRWVAAALSDDDAAWSKAQGGKPVDVDGITLSLIVTDPEQYNQYYNIIANPLLWFIQHEMWNIPRKPSINAEMWDAWKNGYITINKQFADAITEAVNNEPEDRPIIIMPQDYHLYLVPQFLRERLGWRVQVQPFIHIPWPGPDAWRILPEPMRHAIIDSLMQSDRVGFQTRKDAFNFVQTARFYLDGAHSRGSRVSLEYQNRKVYANDYPISIDVDKVESLVSEPQTVLQKNQLMSMIGDLQLILRTDRVEPSKNILRGLEAYRNLLERYPEHIGKVQMMMLLVPSRMEVVEYTNYLQDIMAAAGMINADFSQEFWEPVRVIVGNNYERALAAMQLYHVLLVNPIADGMNLVAKEGVLVNNRDGALVLSENAGAIYELGDHALTISPYDTYSTAEALHQALTMNPGERHRRAEAMRKIVSKADVRAWFASQVEDALKALDSQPKNNSTPVTSEASKSE